jgi:hypothetical protein
VTAIALLLDSPKKEKRRNKERYQQKKEKKESTRRKADPVRPSHRTKSFSFRWVTIVRTEALFFFSSTHVVPFFSQDEVAFERRLLFCFARAAPSLSLQRTLLPPPFYPLTCDQQRLLVLAL